MQLPQEGRVTWSKGLPAAEALAARADSGGCFQAAFPAAEGPSGQRGYHTAHQAGPRVSSSSLSLMGESRALLFMLMLI